MATDTRIADIRDNDLVPLGRLGPPTHRTAYSDRTAWLMAVLADLAYEPFERDDPVALLDLARELAALGGEADAIALRLERARVTLEGGDGGIVDRLREVLAVGGFELVGVFFSRAHTPGAPSAKLFDDVTALRATLQDTQGFVAARRPGSGRDPLAALVFRGTTNVRDWITNARAVLRDPPTSDHRIHPGFLRAWEDVRDDVHGLLRRVEGLPLYVTGHSLGGALATCATYFLPKTTLAGCYTFGGPRVGDRTFADRFKTPIYRVVNGFDPVPTVPPSETLLFYAGRLLTLVPFVRRFVPGVERAFAYAHAGDQRYLSDAYSPDGFGRDWEGLRLERNVDFWGRLMRELRAGKTLADLRDLASYHTMSTYRKKLRWLALRSNPAIAAPAGPAPGRAEVVAGPDAPA